MNESEPIGLLLFDEPRYASTTSAGLPVCLITSYSAALDPEAEYGMSCSSHKIT
jgi:hypothetical protein